MTAVDTIKECCERVWKELGAGYNEVVYQKALNYELNTLGFLTDTERYVNVVYCDSKGFKHVVSTSRIDIFIHGKKNMILELKNISKKIGECETLQVKRYFKELSKEGVKIELGILINFPQVKSEKERLIEFEVINNSLEQIVEPNHL